jgi:hypothetical protein
MANGDGELLNRPVTADARIVVARGACASSRSVLFSDFTVVTTATFHGDTHGTNTSRGKALEL